MKSNWQDIPIRNTYIGLYDGPHATPKPSENGPVFLGIKNIRDNGGLDLSDIRHIAEADFPKWTRRIEPKAGDIVFSYEATLNRYAIIPKGLRCCLGRRLALIRPDVKVVDTRFLFFYFFGKEWRDTVFSNTLIGSTVNRIPLTNFPDFQICIPPFPTQRKIASILSAYDDLIENNLRRIKILEEMAQNLYREWFVKFRFPGHEKVKFMDSPLGKIPEGWEVKPFGKLCSRLHSGGTPSRKKPQFWHQPSIDWYKTRELWDNFLFDSEEKISIEGLQGSSARMFEPGTILMAIYGSPTVGRLGILTKEATCNQAALGIVADSSQVSQQYLFYVLFELRRFFNSIAQGAAQQNISKTTVAKTLCILPPKTLINPFTDSILPIWTLLENLQSTIRNLRQTRDLLLPKLISGKLDVSDLDIQIPEDTA